MQVIFEGVLNNDIKMEKRMWSKEDTITLINLFEGFPELWQKNRKFTEIELKSKKQSNL